MSKVQICNRALSTYLGHQRINSLTEDTAAAEQCNLHYDDTLRSILEAHEWKFATGRQLLALLTNDREDEWSYKYAKPAEALMIRWVNDAVTARQLMNLNRSPDSDRETTAEYIYSDVEDATCEYTKLVTDSTLYPQYFADALSGAMAVNMAIPLTEDFKRYQNAQQMAARALDVAIAFDERQRGDFEYNSVPEHLRLRGIS